VTFTGQVAPAASALPHAAVLTEYSPVVAKVGTGNAPPAIFVNVSDCVAVAPTSRLPKLSDDPESEYPGVPVPVREADNVFPCAVTVSDPLRAPNAVGVKTTTIWQLAPPTTVPQLFDVTAKSPPALAEEIVEVKLELFVQVKVTGALGNPIASEPKS
jgi:hypothetical protein